DAGHAAAEVMRDVDVCGVDLVQVGGQGQQFLIDSICSDGGVGAGDELDLDLSAHRSLAQQPVAGAHLTQPPADPGAAVGEQIVHDGVVVAGQHRDLVPAVVDQQLLQHVIGAVPVEGGDLDGHHGVQLEQSAPELAGQGRAADTVLEVEADRG